MTIRLFPHPARGASCQVSSEDYGCDTPIDHSGVLVALKLLDLEALTLELLLLVLNLPLLLLSRGLLILHRVANDVAGARAQRTADSRAGERMSHCQADQRTCTGAQTPPPSVPSSRVDSGCPLHPASAKAAISNKDATAIDPMFDLREIISIMPPSSP